VIRPDGLLNRSTKNVPEAALEAEMEERLSHRYSDRAIASGLSAWSSES
jgi:transposase-like protein